MCGGNLYRFVSFQSFGHIDLIYFLLIVHSYMFIRIIGGCGGQHPLASVDAMLPDLGRSLDRLTIGLCSRGDCRRWDRSCQSELR